MQLSRFALQPWNSVWETSMPNARDSLFSIKDHGSQRESDIGVYFGQKRSKTFRKRDSFSCSPDPPYMLRHQASSGTPRDDPILDENPSMRVRLA
jgi:hypothetical protein